MKERRVVTAVALAVAMVLSLTACLAESEHEAPPSATPSITPTAPSADPETRPDSEGDEAPDFLPDGTALANKDYFDYVNQVLFGQQPGVADIEILAMLEAAGFDGSAMEVTRGKTPTGRDAEAIEFAVRAHDDCLIGQWGKNVYTSYIAPVLADGSCLIGNTLTLR
ncbi:MAG: hypothetical protein KF680_04825 [Cryobacterium sp.]|nr:hypothetical protein [Cryobacterium sp.]